MTTSCIFMLCVMVLEIRGYKREKRDRSASLSSNEVTSPGRIDRATAHTLHINCSSLAYGVHRAISINCSVDPPWMWLGIEQNNDACAEFKLTVFIIRYRALPLKPRFLSYSPIFSSSPTATCLVASNLLARSLTMFEKQLAPDTEDRSSQNHVHATVDDHDQRRQKIEKALRFKIDLRLCTIAGLLCSLNLLDSGIISSASVTSMLEDLGLVEGNRYSVAILIFTIGALCFQLPATIAVRRIGPRIFFASTTFSFGLITLVRVRPRPKRDHRSSTTR